MLPCKQTLTINNLTFPVRSIVPSKKFNRVAIVGDYQIVVVNLPRRGWKSAHSQTIDCP